jgi:endonuclease/exonuclease/phosphatase family metal-dependent hydrolase
MFQSSPATTHSTPYEQNDNLFRIASLNVHQWNDNRYGDNTIAIANLLAKYHLDVVGLEEVLHDPQKTSDSLKQISTILNMPHIAYSEAGWTGFGNAILSRYPISSKKTLRAKCERSWEIRSMITTTVHAQHPFLQEHDTLFHCLHLDVNYESIRLEQLQKMKQNFDENKLEFILGDFNAIDVTDYSEYYLEKITNGRADARREEPLSDCVAWMKELGFVDTWRKLNPELQDVSSCRFGTRIDFIWQRGELKNGWRVKSCDVVPSRGATDHDLVVCVFEKT